MADIFLRSFSFFKSKIKDVLPVGLCFFALYLLVAIVSYDIQDPGWSYIGNNLPVNNKAGLYGAYLADIIVSIFGFGAYLLPILLVFVSVEYLLNKSSSLRVVFSGLFLFYIAISGMLDLCSSWMQFLVGFFNVEISFNYGGLFGVYLNNILYDKFSYLGLIIIYIFLCAMSFAIILGKNLTDLFIDIFNGFVVGVKHFLLFVKRLLHYLLLVPYYCIFFIKHIIFLALKIICGVNKKLINLISFFNIFSCKKSVNNLNNYVVSDKIEIIKDSKNKELISIANDSADGGCTRVSNQKVVKLDVNLLDSQIQASPDLTEEEQEGLMENIRNTFLDFNVEVKVYTITYGPCVCTVELELARGTKVSKVVGLQKDIARSLCVSSVRICDVIPGTNRIGVEIPNKNTKMVFLSQILKDDVFLKTKHRLPLALGVDTNGVPCCIDLNKMPHLLVAGTTGSGKSVGVNAMLISLLYHLSVDDLRLLLIDPKMLEFSLYENLPHLVAPVITDMQESRAGLLWAIHEMERRYSLMSKLGVRNLELYNKKVPTEEKLPWVVIIIDEFADLIMTEGKKIEELLVRLAQKARAAGIHLILATQRPSVDVVTGLLKANIPSRIAFTVYSRIDSRTILDQQGAEQLLGRGDMLALLQGDNKIRRIHGAFVSDDEVKRIADSFVGVEPKYNQIQLDANIYSSNDDDAFFDKAVGFVQTRPQFSQTRFQEELSIGPRRALRLLEKLQDNGMIKKAVKGYESNVFENSN